MREQGISFPRRMFVASEKHSPRAGEIIHRLYFERQKMVAPRVQKYRFLGAS
jgi:hypothetical protein